MSDAVTELVEELELIKSCNRGLYAENDVLRDQILAEQSKVKKLEARLVEEKSKLAATVDDFHAVLERMGEYRDLFFNEQAIKKHIHTALEQLIAKWSEETSIAAAKRSIMDLFHMFSQ